MYPDQNFLAYLQGAGQNFNPYSAGDKVYGQGSTQPTTGMVDPTGYRVRDNGVKARNNAILQRLKAQVGQRFMSSQYLNPNGRSY